MKNRFAALLLPALLTGASTQADVLELKNGNIMNGKYLGGTATSVRFEGPGGLQVVPIGDIVALTFTGTAVPPATSPTTQPATVGTPPAASSAATAPRTVTLPSGTLLLVRMTDGISSNDKPGTPFTARLEYDLFSGGTKVLPAGTAIAGKVLSSSEARRVRGQSTLDLRLTQIMVGAAPISILTTGYQEAGEKSIKDAARGAAAGAAIGAIVDGGDGAAKGAAIGATAGALKRGQSITVPPGKLIEFKLTQPCSIPAGG